MAEGPPIFSGNGFSLRGEKNRFTLPPDFRNPFQDSAAKRTLCLNKHDRFPCLIGFAIERIETFEHVLDEQEKRADRSGDDEWDRDVVRQLMWGFKRLPFDASGRFIMPDLLVGLGEIDNRVFFQGGGDYFTLWHPEQLYAMGPIWDAAKAACRSFEAEAAAKAKKS